MKITWYVLAGLVVAAFLVAVPAYAASVAISDNELAGISGKNGTAGQTTNFNSSIEGDSSAIIQLASFTWGDDHSADKSNHKGANDVSGLSSAVQQNVVAVTNGINWGAAAVASEDVGAITGDLGGTAMAYAAQHVGGF